MKLTTLWIVRWLAGSSMALALTTAALAEDWPQFRGENASGVSRASTNLPVSFSAEKKVKWKVELGEGIACPVIDRGRVFATSITGDKTFAVFAFDAASGKRLWKREFDTGPLPDITPPNTHASSTPATDGERVFVYFSTYGLRALDARDGSVLWEHALPLPRYLLGWGCANSPIVHEDLVIFNRDDDLAPFLLALDKRTGEVRWRTERPDMLGGYAVPVVCTAAGRTDIVVAGTGKLKGYDPKTGRERWTCNSLLRTVMTTPVVEGERIYIAIQSYGESDRVLKHALLQWKDTNQDGKLTKSEVGAAFEAKFDRGDRNKDGELVDSEIDAAFQSPTNRRAAATSSRRSAGAAPET